MSQSSILIRSGRPYVTPSHRSRKKQLHQRRRHSSRCRSVTNELCREISGLRCSPRPWQTVIAIPVQYQACMCSSSSECQKPSNSDDCISVIFCLSPPLLYMYCDDWLVSSGDDDTKLGVVGCGWVYLGAGVHCAFHLFARFVSFLLIYRCWDKLV